MKSETEELRESIAELTAEIRRLREQQRNWKLAMRNALLSGLGGVLGATVVVSLLLFTLRPFRQIEMLGPMIDRLDQTLQQRQR